MFREGDRVRVIADPENPEAIGREGTVVEYFLFVGVVLDAPVWGYTDKAAGECGWWGTKQRPCPYLISELELA